MSLSTAFNIFVKQSLIDGKIPFEISLNKKQYNKETIKAIKEASFIANDCRVKSYDNTDELFEALDK